MRILPYEKETRRNWTEEGQLETAQHKDTRTGNG
jgi:hypothetical protein